jgi:hypothetical protein
MLAAGRRTSAAAVIGWPVLRFAWLYFLRGESRLGGHGVVHAGLKAASDFMRLAKLWELQLAERGSLPTEHPLAPGSDAQSDVPRARSGRHADA